MKPALLVNNLSVRYRLPAQALQAVKEASFHLSEGEVLGLVGESACGKSSLASALIGLLSAHEFRADSIQLGETELCGLPDSQLRQIRGRDISMVFQDPQAALNPVRTIGSQFCEVARRHLGLGREGARKLGRDQLAALGISDAARVMQQYPHQLSGGMCQRAALAMATACKPRVLIADEPTSALDVTTQAQVLDLIATLAQQNGTATLLITHDLGVASTICDRILVMDGGEIIEEGPSRQILSNPCEARTRALLDAVPRLDDEPHLKGDSSAGKLLELEKWSVSHRIRVNGRRRMLPAVRDISLRLRRGEIFGLAGESGCGKSTLAQSLLGLYEARAGVMSLYDGDEQHVKNGSVNQRVQIIFQNPAAALSPRRTVWQSLIEPLAHFKLAHPSQWGQRVEDALFQVGLSADIESRLPSELSGGQAQRVALARAIIAQPDLIIADEPFSALDASVQARIIRLIGKLRDNLGISFLIISHDLAILRLIADRVAVMYLGRIVESAPSHLLFSTPAHPYTRGLMEAAQRATLGARKGEQARDASLEEPPSPLTPPRGCVFHTRCPDAMSQCGEVAPTRTTISGQDDPYKLHTTHCHLYE